MEDGSGFGDAATHILNLQWVSASASGARRAQCFDHLLCRQVELQEVANARGGLSLNARGGLSLLFMLMYLEDNVRLTICHPQVGLAVHVLHFHPVHFTHSPVAKTILKCPGLREHKHG